MIAEHMQWASDLTELRGKIMPRSTATAPDMRTAIEIIGPPEQVRQISVVGDVVTVDSARQLAQYMVMAMQLILPQWDGANDWLTQSLRLAKRAPRSVRMHGWNVRMEWLEASKTVTLKASR